MSSREATKGRWAFEDFGAGRIGSELDRAILVATDCELIEAARKILAEVRRRAARNPAPYELYGLISTLPETDEPTKGFFASITAKSKEES